MHRKDGVNKFLRNADKHRPTVRYTVSHFRSRSIQMLKYSIFPQLTWYISFYADCPCSLSNVTICLFLTEAALAFCPLCIIAAPVPHTVRNSTVITRHSFGDSTASGLRASNLAIEIRFPAQLRIVSSPKRPAVLGPTHISSRSLLPTKAAGGEPDHSNPSSAEAKNERN
jgi:hypothetical protein